MGIEPFIRTDSPLTCGHAKRLLIAPDDKTVIVCETCRTEFVLAGWDNGVAPLPDGYGTDWSPD